MDTAVVLGLLRAKPDAIDPNVRACWVHGIHNHLLMVILELLLRDKNHLVNRQELYQHPQVYLLLVVKVNNLILSSMILLTQQV